MQLKCPVCGEPVWVLDRFLREHARGRRPIVIIPERIQTCSNCEYEGAGFCFLASAPFAFLLQPCSAMPMGRKAFRYWLEILKENFPDHPRLQGDASGFYPCIPDLRDQVGAALQIMSFMLESKQRPVRPYGAVAETADSVCLNILFDHHFRRQFNLPPADTERRLLAHVEDGEEVEVIGDGTLKRLVLHVYGEAQQVVRQKPTFVQWRDNVFFGLGLDAFHRFNHQAVYPPMPQPADWRYVDSRSYAPLEQQHRALQWPLEDLL